jgi:hypothetical protein
MALPIIENPLYGLIQLETAAWSSPFTWIDRTADLAGGFNYSEGGRLSTAGQAQVEVGTLNATFSDAATIPAIGDLVRLRRYGTTEYAFTGYVQDVSQRIVFDQSVSFNTPITLTTINCLDWVGYISQFQAVGVGGVQFIGGADITDSSYLARERTAALNKIIDPAYTTLLIKGSLFTGGREVGDTDFVGSFTEHLNLLASSTLFDWRGNHTIPTNKTTGRTSLVQFDQLTVNANQLTFTDEVGTAGQLHYVEIDRLNSTQNVANNIVINNRTRFNVPDLEITRIGGFNEENYMVINNSNVVGVAVDSTENMSDASSITTYGIRQSVVESNISMTPASAGSFNLIINPSMEYSDDGYTGSTNAKVRRRQPLQDANPFAAYSGLWAMRLRQSTAAANNAVFFSGGEADGIPVVAGTTYYIKGYAARGTVSRTDMISSMRIDWLDDNEANIGNTTTANTTLTTANTWYLVSGSGVAPAGAVRATIRMSFARSGGGNITVGDRMWSDALLLSKTTDTYFDGDTAQNATNAFIWTGGVGASPSYKLINNVDTLGTDLLARYSSTSIKTTRIRWNAQEDLSQVSKLVVGQYINVRFNGVTNTRIIIGIDGNVDSDRYMIDYYLR